MAPITTAVEFAFKPTETIKIEHPSIQLVCPLKGISAIIDPWLPPGQCFAEYPTTRKETFLYYLKVLFNFVLTWFPLLVGARIS